MCVTYTVFFTQLYYPDMTTTAIIMSDLAEDLASYGMDIKVICAQPTYVKNLDPQITPVPSVELRGPDSGMSASLPQAGQAKSIAHGEKIKAQS